MPALPWWGWAGLAVAGVFSALLLRGHTATAGGTIPADQGLGATPTGGASSGAGVGADAMGPLPSMPLYLGNAVQQQQLGYAPTTSTAGSGISSDPTATSTSYPPGVNPANPFSVAAAVQAGQLDPSALSPFVDTSTSAGRYAGSVVAQQQAIAQQYATTPIAGRGGTNVAR